MSVTEALVGQETTIQLRLTSDVGDVTLGIVDANGDTVVAAGAATTKTVTTYSYDLAAQDAPNLLTVTWTDDDNNEYVTHVEVVRNVLFTLHQARNVTYTGLQTPLASASSYEDVDILRTRRRITEQFEDRTGRPWTRRYARVEMTGSGGRALFLHKGHHRTAAGEPTGSGAPAKVLSVTVGGSSVSLSNVKIDGGSLWRTDTWWPYGSTSDPFNVVVEYEYGPHPVPAEANEHGIRVAVATLVPSDVSGYAQAFTNEDGTVQFGPHGLAYPARTWEWLKKHPRVFVG